MLELRLSVKSLITVVKYPLHVQRVPHNQKRNNWKYFSHGRSPFCYFNFIFCLFVYLLFLFFLGLTEKLEKS